jgi:NAD(P)-dependent dehydrogenase (short-subunit alcohol dehydrogenase family)
MFRLDGKVALVTGAATGLGAGIAVALARQGADVALVGRPGGDALAETEARTRAWGHRVYGLEMDLRDVPQIERGVQAVVATLGRIDILVNNAGINRPAPALDVSEANWDDLFTINVKGGFFLAQKVAPGMIAHGWGRVIWVSSQAGSVAIPNQSTYCASKGAVNQLVRTLGVEWAKHGLTVNAIAPTFVETALTRQRLEQPAFRAFVLNKIPAGKLAQVEHVAAAAVYLASEEAAMVNCHVLHVDGGWTAW